MNANEIQQSVAAIMALKQAYDVFKPKKKDTVQQPQKPIVFDDKNLRKKAYVGLDSLSLTNNMEQ